MMKEKKTIKKKSQLNLLRTNNNYNYMLNDEREKMLIERKNDN